MSTKEHMFAKFNFQTQAENNRHLKEVEGVRRTLWRKVANRRCNTIGDKPSDNGYYIDHRIKEFINQAGDRIPRGISCS